MPLRFSLGTRVEVCISAQSAPGVDIEMIHVRNVDGGRWVPGTVYGQEYHQEGWCPTFCCAYFVKIDGDIGPDGSPMGSPVREDSDQVIRLLAAGDSTSSMVDTTASAIGAFTVGAGTGTGKKKKKKKQKKKKLKNGEWKVLAQKGEDSDEERERIAAAKNAKELGNEHFRNGRFVEAYSAYSDALSQTELSEARTRAVLFSNRAAALLKQSKFREALEDAEEALSSDPSFTKGVLRAVAALEGLGQKKRANAYYSKMMGAARRSSCVGLQFHGPHLNHFGEWDGTPATLTKTHFNSNQYPNRCRRSADEQAYVHNRPGASSSAGICTIHYMHHTPYAPCTIHHMQHSPYAPYAPLKATR
jgi:hypothetical protein